MRYSSSLGFAPLLAVAPATGPAAPFVIGAALAPLVFKAISGLWTKDQCKVEYDAARQQFYDYEAGLVNTTANSWEAWKAAGTLTYERGAWIVNQMTAALDQFKTYTDRAKTVCDPAWVDTRFHDYYDFFLGIVNGYKSQLAQLDTNTTGAGSIIQGIGSAIGRLVDPTPGAAYLPQAGSLPPVNTLPALYRDSGPAPAAGGIPPGLLWGGLALVGGYLFFSRSR
jgi:hypothetical protein